VLDLEGSVREAAEARLREEQIAWITTVREAPAAYLEKYARGIEALGLTPASMLARYSTTIRITPTRTRAW